MSKVCVLINVGNLLRGSYELQKRNLPHFIVFSAKYCLEIIRELEEEEKCYKYKFSEDLYFNINHVKTSFEPGPSHIIVQYGKIGICHNLLCI